MFLKTCMTVLLCEDKRYFEKFLSGFVPIQWKLLGASATCLQPYVSIDDLSHTGLKLHIAKRQKSSSVTFTNFTWRQLISKQQVKRKF